jgi:hypothetical protein
VICVDFKGFAEDAHHGGQIIRNLPLCPGELRGQGFLAFESLKALLLLDCVKSMINELDYKRKWLDYQVFLFGAGIDKFQLFTFDCRF